MLEVEVCDRSKIRGLFNLSPEANALLDRKSNLGHSVFDNWFMDYCSFREILTLDEFRAKYRDGYVDNFVYHRDSGLVFNTLGHAHHQHFMGGMYVLHRMGEGWIPAEEMINAEDWQGNKRLRPLDYWNDNSNSCAWDNQDKYLERGLGVYQSSCGKRFYRHEDFYMNAAEFNSLSNLEEWHVYTKTNN